MFKYFFILLSILIVSACSKDDSSPTTPTYTVNTITFTQNDGSVWQAGPDRCNTLSISNPEQGVAAIWKNDTLLMTGTSSNNTFVLILAVNPELIGNYGLNYKVSKATPSSQRFYFGSKANWPIGTDTSNNASINVQITSFDTVNKTISGLFSGVVNWNKSNVLMRSGSFYKVSYSRVKAIPPVISFGTVSQKVNDTIWQPTQNQIACEVRGDSLLFLATKKGASAAQDVSILANIKLSSARMGTYTLQLNQTTNDFRYMFYGNINSFNTFVAGRDYNIAGTMIITKFDVVKKTLSFTYQFSQRVGTKTTVISNGQADDIKFR